MRRNLSLVLGSVLIVGLLLMRKPFTDWVGYRAVLTNPDPPSELVEDFLNNAPDPVAAIAAAWDTGRIVQREAAVRVLARNQKLRMLEQLPTPLETIALWGALDPDLNVRETCLNLLSERHDPLLAALIAAQLRDCDPQICLLGLDYLKDLPPAAGVPLLISALDNQSPLVVAKALKLLERWSDQKFELKLSDMVSMPDNAGLLKYPEDSANKVKRGIAQARRWWMQHQSEFSPLRLELPDNASIETPLPIADDFALRALDGRMVRLSDFRGKVVLINFWTTWCTACMGELPELAALQNEHKENLKILGISLDFVPLDDGDNAADISGKPEALRAKILRTVQARDIQYPVLIDEHNEIGGRFNGGELPTTVIVDAEGRLRRRFVGARELSVFEAMIAEAGKPVKKYHLAQRSMESLPRRAF